MLGHCRHLDYRLDMNGQTTEIFHGRDRETNLEAEAHSHALHIRPVHGRMRNYSEGVVQIVIVDCE
jgi:hypothetical protein